MEVSPLPAGTPLERQVLPLLANLAHAADPGYAALWLPDVPPGVRGAPEPGNGWAVLLWCQVRAGAGVPAALRAGPARSITDQRRRPGVQALTEVLDSERTVATIMVGSGDHGPAVAVPGPLLHQTRDCVALLLRERRLTLALHDQVAGTDRLAERLTQVEADLAAVREVERQRLAGWVLAGTTRQLSEVTRRWQDCASDVRANPEHALGVLRGLRRSVNDLIDDFRTVVRAVHPSMLRSRGTVAALSELASQLPRGVRFIGDLGRRVGWEVESGIYHATAAALSALTESAEATGPPDVTAVPDATGTSDVLCAAAVTGLLAVTSTTGGASTAGMTTAQTAVVAGAAPPPLSVRFMRTDGRLMVRISDPSPPPAGEVRAALADDMHRMEALGGGLTYHVSRPGAGLVELWLPERLTGIDVPASDHPPTRDPQAGDPGHRLR
jgi:signal transduction histidine kinase